MTTQPSQRSGRPRSSTPMPKVDRGLAIVSMLAARWGVEMTDTGKAIWFELDLP
jgi:hypothetical protein